MMKYENREYKTTEFRIGHAIVRIHDPHQTEKQKAEFRKRIEAAAIRLLQHAEKQRQKAKKLV